MREIAEKYNHKRYKLYYDTHPDLIKVYADM